MKNTYWSSMTQEQRNAEMRRRRKVAEANKAKAANTSLDEQSVFEAGLFRSSQFRSVIDGIIVRVQRML